MLTKKQKIQGGKNIIDQSKRTRCEVYSRVVGFLTPVSQWNKGKKEEFRDRKTFKIGDALKTGSR